MTKQTGLRADVAALVMSRKIPTERPPDLTSAMWERLTRYRDGESVPQIARSEGVSVQAVRLSLTFAVARLQSGPVRNSRRGIDNRGGK